MTDGAACVRATYNCKYMGQITIYLDEATEKLVRRHVKSSGEPASRWIAEAVRRRASSEWPDDVLALFGSWKDDDFPDASELRKGYGKDAKRERL
jgi:hypothetical protein